MLDVLIANWVLIVVSLIAGSTTVMCFYYKELSERELFTGCYTKDWAITRKNSKLVRMMKHTNKKGIPFGLAFIDFDDFKKINDSEGHEHGDEVILGIVKSITHILWKRRTNGISIRFGGDELMVLIPNTCEKELRLVCEGMVWKVRNQVQCTISVGGALFHKGDEVNVGQFIEKADKNLYAAKENGKDCAVVA